MILMAEFLSLSMTIPQSQYMVRSDSLLFRIWPQLKHVFVVSDSSILVTLLPTFIAL